MELMTITKKQLEAALLAWELRARDGKTRGHDETRALPADQVAAESAAHLWSTLDGLRES